MAELKALFDARVRLIDGPNDGQVWLTTRPFEINEVINHAGSLYRCTEFVADGFVFIYAPTAVSA